MCNLASGTDMMLGFFISVCVDKRFIYPYNNIE
ncbi:hypothetical protein EDD57_12433 [Baia soyae]|uniref:Uncharacterized protein n=1 Tax=Baia soyae TaxID=1544746 RepID=A0A4R2RT31_9BACL|nr:hypothetical protein EDD57_12433 [Baia soyae]